MAPFKPSGHPSHSDSTQVLRVALQRMQVGFVTFAICQDDLEPRHFLTCLVRQLPKQSLAQQRMRTDYTSRAVIWQRTTLSKCGQSRHDRASVGVCVRPETGSGWGWGPRALQRRGRQDCLDIGSALCFKKTGRETDRRRGGSGWPRGQRGGHGGECTGRGY